MARSLRWTALVGLSMAILAGCSRQPSAPLQQSESDQPRRAGTLAPLWTAPPEAEAVRGQYIVVFKDDVSDVTSSTDDVERTHGFKAVHRYSHALKGFTARLSPEALDRLRQDPRVDYIEEDQVAHIVATETNPTWGLDRIDQRTLPIDASYTYDQTGAGVDVYCVDTGIRLTHADFGGRAVTGYDAVTPGGTAMDGNGHGTHTAGTIGGTLYGVAKGVRLIAVRVLDNNGSGTYSQVIAGVDWVTANHTTRPAVANLSIGGPRDAALDQAVRNSIADGVVYCVAAGNMYSDASTQSPADVAEAITVGATDNADAFAYFSNFGSLVDILAPGLSITSDYFLSDTSIASMSGTSMSTPHVTGAVALYLEAHPGTSPADVQTALIENATTGLIRNLPSGTPNRLLFSLLNTAPPVVPSAPILSSPWNGASGVTVPAGLAWNYSAGATSYRLQVSTDPGFAATAYDQAAITASTASVGGLAYSTLYYWRVNATNSAGTSAWSTVSSFTTAATPPSPPPLPPVLASPRNGASNLSRSLTLDWYASTGATSYRVQVSTSPYFTTTVYDRSQITSSSVYVTGLGSRVTYYWRVNATNASGTSLWSAAWSFRTKH